MRRIEAPFCPRYGTPFAVDLGLGEILSARAIADPPVFSRGRAVALYDGIARELVHKLKYGDRLDLAPVMARMMAASARDLLAECDGVVPVPLHRWRLWRRRFNQAALLGRAVAEAGDKPFAAQALKRVKATRPQVGLTRAARAENLQGAFAVPPGARHLVAGRRILLVDDVSTTGSTGNAAARALLRAGAASVDLLTFALVDDSAG